MKITRLACVASVLLMFGAVFAQDFDDFGSGDFGGDFGSDFGGDFGGGSSSSPLTISGDASVAGRAYVDRYHNYETIGKSPKDWKTEAIPSFKLNLEYAGSKTDLQVKFKLDNNSLGDYNWDILDEFTARAYLGSLQLEAGKMRIVWGKGDKLHVLDNFNANDYTDYIIPDYIDRRIAEPMFRAIYSTPSNFKVEAVYTPMMTPDRLAKKGMWIPKSSRVIESTVKSIGTNDVSVASKRSGGLFSAELAKALSDGSSFDADSLYQDTKKLKYGQAGLRTTFSIASVDLGLSYYYGHLKQPSVNKSKIRNAMIMQWLGYVAGINNLKGMCDYDRVQVFGLEGAFIVPVVGLNTRFEGAYNMTEDLNGKDPDHHNPFVSWVAGFDRDLPIHNINLNVQTQGKYILHTHKIDHDDVDYIERKHGGRIRSNNKIVVNITDTYNYEKVKVDLKGIYGIEQQDLIVMPTLTFKVADGFTTDLSGLFIWSRNEYSEFDGWNHNSFIQIRARYTF